MAEPIAEEEMPEREAEGGEHGGEEEEADDGSIAWGEEGEGGAEEVAHEGRGEVDEVGEQ